MEVRVNICNSPRNAISSGSPIQLVTTPFRRVLNLNDDLIECGRGSIDVTEKQKRGRPMKYDSEGNLRLRYHSAPPSGFSFGSVSEFSTERGYCSGTTQPFASLDMFADTTIGNFTPHLVTVQAGEDVAGKIYSFAEKGPIGIFILSANGTISEANLRQPDSSGDTLTYVGVFELLSLSGSITISENGDIDSNGGGLIVALAGSDGRVIGGGVAGLLIAARPIQIVLGSFIPKVSEKHKMKQNREHSAEETVARQANTMMLFPLPERSQRESPNTTIDAADEICLEDLSGHWSSPDINITLLELADE